MERPRLPEQFSTLQDLADRFAIGDDVARDRAMQSAGVDELQGLVEDVSPRFEEINAYLDSHDDESACLLGTLAEATCEAQLDLDRRSRS